MKKMNTFSPFRLMTILVLVSGTTAMADISYVFDDDCEFDNVLIGATMTRTNSANLADIATMTSWDVLAPTDAAVTNITSARVDGSAHKTNKYGSRSGLGINNAHIGGSEYGQFSNGESWVIKFDKDVYLTSIDLGSVSGDDAMELLVAGDTKFTFDYSVDGSRANDPYDLGNTFVSAGTEVTFADFGGGSITIDTITVTTIPEPATLGLIALTGVGLFVVRRFQV